MSNSSRKRIHGNRCGNPFKTSDFDAHIEKDLRPISSKLLRKFPSCKFQDLLIM